MSRVVDAREAMPADLKSGDRILLTNRDRLWWQFWKPSMRLYRVKSVRPVISGGFD